MELKYSNLISCDSFLPKYSFSANGIALRVKERPLLVLLCAIHIGLINDPQFGKPKSHQIRFTNVINHGFDAVAALRLRYYALQC